MKIFRKKTPVGRRRLAERLDSEAAADRASTERGYNASRRAELSGNTGRQSPIRSPIERTGTARTATGFWRYGIRRIGAFILIVAIAVSVVNMLSVSPHAKIEPLTSSVASSAFLRNTADYQTAADKLLGASLLNRNKITIDTTKIAQELTQQFPELSGVSITLPLFAHRPIVYVEPAHAALVVAADNGAFVVDNNGKALMPGANLPTAHNLPQVVDQSGLTVQVNHQVLTSDDVAFIETVIAELSARHVAISSMTLPAASRELDVYISGQRYFVKFNLQNNDARQQAGTYLATAAELQREHATPAHYIDVRVDGRAYYQ